MGLKSAVVYVKPNASVSILHKNKKARQAYFVSTFQTHPLTIGLPINQLFIYIKTLKRSTLIYTRIQLLSCDVRWIRYSFIVV